MKKMLIGFQRSISILTLTSLIFSFVAVEGASVRTETTQPAAISQPSDQSSELNRTDYGNMRLLFEVNEGQTDRQVKFVSRGPGYTLYLKDDGAVFSLKVRDDVEVKDSEMTGKLDRAKMNTRSES